MSLRVLVIGFGFMGQTHAGSILKNPEAELAGIVDPFNPAERLGSIKGNTNSVCITAEDVAGIPHYTDMEEAFRQAHADACIIALPTKLHVEGVLKALSHGLHVMVEKPFAIEIADCDTMVRAAENAGRILAVGQSARCGQDNQFIRSCILDRRFGKLKYMDLFRACGLPDWGNWKDPVFFRASGGALFDMVSHDLDFTRYCLGEPDEVSADPRPARPFAGNLISAVLRFGDAVVQVRGGFLTPSKFPFKRHYTVCFENAALTSEIPGECSIVDANGIHAQELPACSSHRLETDRFVEACLGRGEVYCTGADAAGTIRLCWKIRECMNAEGAR